MSRPRHAVYFAPAVDTPLSRRAAAVIGREPAGGAAVPFPDAPPCDAEDWSALTVEPRRYGFHATLKAPFELAEGTDETLLLEAARAFAAIRAPFVVPDVGVALLGDFVALRPITPCVPLDRLAADCVVAFEPFRAPLDAAERTRRLGPDPSERRIAMVDRWGYPHVFEDFRFHMTLTGPLPPARREPVCAALADLFADLVGPLPVDAIAIFRQESRSGPFRLVERLPFAAAA